MKIYDVSALKAQYIKPESNLSVWASANLPDTLCNASLYNGVQTRRRPTGQPIGTIIENGEVVHNDGNGFGFGIVDGRIVFGRPWEQKWETYLTGYNCPVLEGQYVKPSFTDRYVFDCALDRIGIGYTKDGKTVIVCDDRVTLQQFAEHAISAGVVTLVNLDGGGSRHLLYNGKTLYASSRVPYNAIAFFAASSSKQDQVTTEGGSMRKYLDVSAHQGQIDWEKVKAEGEVAGVIIRAGYGKNQIDAQFVRNASECNRLGIPCGAYWFSYAVTAEEAEAEANYLLNAVKPYRMELPMAYDFEYDSVNNAKKRGVTITKALASSFVRAFCNTIEKAGYWAINYANPDYLSRYFDGETAARYGLWLAQWPGKVDVTKPPRNCAIWQWGTSTVPGIKTIVDTNEAYTDFATLIRQYKMNNLTTEPESEDPIVTPEPQTPQYADAMSFMEDRGWMKNERPNDALTRAEFAAVMQRIYDNN